MDYAGIPLLNVLKSRLNYDSARQAELAKNIANADTPNFKAMDIPTPDFKKIAGNVSGGTAQKLQMVTTDPKHINLNASGLSYKAEQRKTTYELTPNGNNVVIEEELPKMAETAADYQKGLNLYGKTLSLFKTAIGRPSGS